LSSTNLCDHLPLAFENSIGIVSINPQLFDPTGGIFFGLLAGLIYGHRKHFHFWSIMDILTPGLAVMGVVFGIAHLASGFAFGKPTRLPWGISLWGEIRHPSQVYETFIAGLMLSIILILIKRAMAGHPESFFWSSSE
jgi:phosphatidylglycerol:prolipoprotein diacylglycerol transferase